jgi:hypothetical protein
VRTTIEPSLDWRVELITTISRVTRIPLLAIFFVSVVDFTLDSARIDLVLMTAALAILFWGGNAEALNVGRTIAVCFGYSPPPSQASHAHAPPNTLVIVGPYLTHERSTRPISKAKASGWETGSTFCSRGPDRQLAHLPSEGDSLQTKRENFARKRVTALRRPSTLLRTFPW